MQDMLQQIVNQYVAESIGGKYYESVDGFTIEKLYAIAGKSDSVVTMSFHNNTNSYKQFGEAVTGVYQYTQQQRKDLEKFLERQTNGDEVKEHYGNVSVKVLELDVTEDRKRDLLKGVNTADLSSILVMPNWESFNQYGSREDRKPHIMPIEIDMGCSKDGSLMWYNFLCQLLRDGVGLCPAEQNEYLALRYLFEPDSFNEVSSKLIFDVDGKMIDCIEEYYLKNKSLYSTLSEEETNRYNKLFAQKVKERIRAVRYEIQKSGHNIEDKTILDFIIERCLSYQEKRYSVTGKYPIYLDFTGYLHILLRHTRECQLENNYKDKGKFQMKLENITYVLRKVVDEVNDEYQQKRARGERTDFNKNKDQAVYVLGDYYAIRIGEKGNIISFYKETRDEMH